MTTNNTFSVNVYTTDLDENGVPVLMPREFAIPKNVIDTTVFMSEFRICAYVGLKDDATLRATALLAKKDRSEEDIALANVYHAIAALYADDIRAINGGQTMEVDRFSSCLAWAVFPQCRRATNGDRLSPTYGLDAFFALEEFEDKKIDRKELKNRLNHFADFCFKSAESTIFRTFSCRANDVMTDAIIHSFRGTIYKYRKDGIKKRGLTRENVIANIMLAYLAHTFEFSAEPVKRKAQVVEF